MRHLILLVAVILNLVMATSAQSSHRTKVVTTGLGLVLGCILLAEFLGVIPTDTTTQAWNERRGRHEASLPGQTTRSAAPAHARR